MNSSDLDPLRLYCQCRDAEAFAVLVNSYSRLVYGAALRILGSEHEAEDVAQECFVELAQKAGTIRGSVAGWLHSLATSRSLDRIRSETSRRKREVVAMEINGHGEETLDWEAMRPHVDEAIALLPNDERMPVMLHFLDGRSQTEVGRDLGISQSEVSRRVQKGVESIRSFLDARGLVCGVALLTASLAQGCAPIVPAAVKAALGKIALAGIRPEVAGASTIGAKTGATAISAIGIKATIAVLTLVAVVSAVVIGVKVYQDEPTANPTASPTGSPQTTTVKPPTEAPLPLLERKIDVSYVAARLPAVLDDLMIRTGLRSAYEWHLDETFTFTLDAKALPVRDLLDKLAAAGHMDVRYEDDLAVFWSGKNQEVERALARKKISFEFIESPLPDALAFLQAISGVEFILDGQLGASQKPLVNIKIQDMSVSRALNWILRLARLDYQICHGKLFIARADLLPAFLHSACFHESSLAVGPHVMRVQITQSVAELQALLDDPKPRVRLLAVHLLTAHPDQHAVALLAKAAADRDEGVRKQAVICLGFRGGKDDLPTLETVLNGTNPEVSRRALTALGRIGGERARDLIQASLGRPKIKTAAIRGLGRLGVGADVPLLAGFLNDPDDLVRNSAAQALADLGGEPARLLLEKRLANEPAVEVRMTLIHALGNLGDPQSLPALEDSLARELALGKSDSWARYLPARSVRKIDDPRAIASLERIVYQAPEIGWTGIAKNAPLPPSITRPEGLRMLVRLLNKEAGRLPPAERRLRRRLQRPVSFEFNKTPLEEAINFLVALTHVNMDLNPRALEGQDWKKTPITLRVKGMPIGLALEKILKPAGLDYALRPDDYGKGSIYIASPNQLEQDAPGDAYDSIRLWAAAMLMKFKGNFVRDALLARIKVEPQGVVIKEIVGELRHRFREDSEMQNALIRKFKPRPVPIEFRNTRQRPQVPEGTDVF